MTWKLFLTVLMSSTCFLSTCCCLFSLMTLWKSTLRVFHSPVLRTVGGVWPPGFFRASSCCYQQCELVLSMSPVPCHECEYQSTVWRVNYGQISLPLCSRNIHHWEGNCRDWPATELLPHILTSDIPIPEVHDSTGPFGWHIIALSLTVPQYFFDY